MGWFSKRDKTQARQYNANGGEARRVLGCHNVGCECATDPYFHSGLAPETAQERDQRQLDMMLEWR